ncbi:sulfatase-like hydrolase/transferase, partial [Candidatus Aminicenantes bacterium AC-335-O07]|nr:sulfatase-like hydrolase/transferase [Candidatus Aminicenantes bacterium AC-335-O07]
YFLIIKAQKPSFSKLKGKKTFNYILITVDTLRADRIHCYGFNKIETPYIDLFAEKGIKFERCIAQTPLTLPSHTSLLTGTQPIFHGVRDNGGFLVPQELITIAELFKEKGYNTSAFVSAYVLDSKWGLNQGFDYYFDRFDLSKFKTISLGRVQRRGEETMDEALAWLKKHKDKKFFTWIHLYDPHTPYDPPSPFKEKYPGRPYVGEVAYTDYQLGRLWNYLEENNLLDKTIIVFTSDHGESLGEHKESTHGFFIYQEAIHVPLIFVFPFKKLQGLVRSQVVSLVDIMPTILEMAGIPLPSQIQGKSLVPLFFNNNELEDNFAYSETYYPRFHYGWSELKGIQNKRYKLIIAPKIELYDLINDPDEKINLASKEPEILNELKTLANRFMEEASKNAFQVDYRQMDEETRQKLTALGYIGTFTDQSQLEGKELADPKDKITVFNRLSRARELGLEGKFEEAVRIIKKIIREDPDIIDAYFTLGNLYFKENKFDKAIEYFFKVLERKPNDTFTIINIANSYIKMGKLEDAEKIILDSIENVTPDSQLYFILGNIKNSQKKYDEAIRYYKNCLELNPYSASAYSALGGIYIIQNKLDEAEEYLKRALELNPKLTNLHYNYAQFFEKKGDLLRAAEEYKKELENIPHNFRASFNLSRIYRILGDVENEEKYLNKTIESNPNFPLSYFYLARIYLNQGRDYKKAIELVKKGISLKPEREYLPFGYFLLADLYNRLGNDVLSQKYAEKGKEIQSSTNH